MTANSAIFTPLLLAALFLFAAGSYKRLSLVSLGRPEERFNSLGRRIREMLVYAFGQLRVIRKPFGINHFLIFWAFIVLLLANGEFLIKGVFPSFSLGILPEPIYRVLLVAFDVVSLLTIVCIILSISRRLLFSPAYLESKYVNPRSIEAFLILFLIGLLMLAYFGL